MYIDKYPNPRYDDINNHLWESWNTALKHLFDDITYYNNEDDIFNKWERYCDWDENYSVRIHNIGIGLLLDEEWGDQRISRGLDRLNYIYNQVSTLDGLDPALRRFKRPYKYLQHPLLKQENYKKFLKSAYWQEGIKNLKNSEMCQLCGIDFYNDKNKLHVHHNHYSCHGFEHLRKVYNNFLICLCSDCHTTFHKNKSANQRWSMSK